MKELNHGTVDTKLKYLLKIPRLLLLECVVSSQAVQLRRPVSIAASSALATLVLSAFLLVPEITRSV